jgi:serine/threonine protein kinase
MRQEYSFPSDIFSYGMVLFELLSMKRPYEGRLFEVPDLSTFFEIEFIMRALTSQLPVASRPSCQPMCSATPPSQTLCGRIAPVCD